MEEARSEVIQVRLTPTIKMQLKKVAEWEKRSISSVAALAIDLYCSRCESLEEEKR